MCLVDHPSGCARVRSTTSRLRIRSARTTRRGLFRPHERANGLRRRVTRNDVGIITRSKQSAISNAIKLLTLTTESGQSSAALHDDRSGQHPQFGI